MKSAHYHPHRRPHRHYSYREREGYPRELSPRNNQYSQFRAQHHSFDRNLREPHRPVEANRYQDIPMPHPNSFRFDKDSLPASYPEAGPSRPSKKPDLFYAPERPPGPQDEFNSRGPPEAYEGSVHNNGDGDSKADENMHDEIESGSEDGAYSDRFQDIDPSPSHSFRRPSSSGDRPPHGRPSGPFMGRGGGPPHNYRSFDRYKSGPPFNYSKRYPDGSNPGFRSNSRYENFNNKGSTTFRSYKVCGSDLYRPGHNKPVLPPWSRHHSYSKYGSSSRENYYRSDSRSRSRSRSPTRTPSEQRSPSRSRSRYTGSLSPKAASLKKLERSELPDEVENIPESPAKDSKEPQFSEIRDRFAEVAQQPQFKHISPKQVTVKPPAATEQPSLEEAPKVIKNEPTIQSPVRDQNAEDDDIHWFDDEDNVESSVKNEKSPQIVPKEEVDSAPKTPVFDSEEPSPGSSNVKGALQPNHMPIKFTLGSTSSIGIARSKSNHSSRISLAMNEDDPNADDEPEQVPVTKPSEEKRYLPPQASLLEASNTFPPPEDYARRKNRSRHSYEHRSYGKYRSYAKFSDSESDSDSSKGRYNHSPKRRPRSNSSEKIPSTSSVHKQKEKSPVSYTDLDLPLGSLRETNKLKPLVEESEHSTPRVDVDDSVPDQVKPSISETNEAVEEKDSATVSKPPIAVKSPTVDSEQAEITVDEIEEAEKPEIQVEPITEKKEIESADSPLIITDNVEQPVGKPDMEEQINGDEGEETQSEKSSDPINIEEENEPELSVLEASKSADATSELDIFESKDEKSSVNNSLGLTIDPPPIDLSTKSPNLDNSIPQDLPTPENNQHAEDEAVNGESTEKDESSITISTNVDDNNTEEPNIEFNTSPITTPELESDKGQERLEDPSPKDPHNQPYNLNSDSCHPILQDDWCRQVYLDNQALSKENSDTFRLPPTVYKNFEDNPSVKKIVKDFNQTEGQLLKKLKNRRTFIKNKELALKLRYKKLHDKWKRRDQFLTSKANDEKFAQMDLNGNSDNDSSKRVTRSRRAGLFNGDAVRSEAELNEILERLGSSAEGIDLSDRVATIPPMILDPNEKEFTKFDNRNNIIENPTVYFVMNANSDVWDEKEEELFIQGYLQHPKQFGKISEYVKTKNQTQCVLFYYLNKKRLHFKDLLNKGRRYANVGRRRKAQTQNSNSQTPVQGGGSEVGRRKDKNKSSKLTEDIENATVKKSKAGRKRKNPELNNATTSSTSTNKPKRTGRPPKSSYISQTSTAVASPKNEVVGLSLNDVSSSVMNTPKQQEEFIKVPDSEQNSKMSTPNISHLDPNDSSQVFDRASEDKTISKEITPTPVIEVDAQPENEARKFTSSPDRTVSVDRTISNDHTESPPEFNTHSNQSFPPDPRPIPPQPELIANPHYHQHILASNYQAAPHPQLPAINTNLLLAVDHASKQAHMDRDYIPPPAPPLTAPITEPSHHSRHRPLTSKHRGGPSLGGIDSLLNNNPEPELQASKWDNSAIMEWFGGDSNHPHANRRPIKQEAPQQSAPTLPSLQALHLPASQPRADPVKPTVELFRPILQNSYPNIQHSPHLPSSGSTSGRRDSISYSRPSAPPAFYTQYSEPSDPYLSSASQARQTPPVGSYVPSSTVSAVYTHHNPSNQFRIGSTSTAQQSHPSLGSQAASSAYDAYPPTQQRPTPPAHSHPYSYPYSYAQSSYKESSPSVPNTHSGMDYHRSSAGLESRPIDYGHLQRDRQSTPTSYGSSQQHQQRYLRQIPIVGSTRVHEHSRTPERGSHADEDRERGHSQHHYSQHHLHPSQQHHRRH